MIISDKEPIILSAHIDYIKLILYSYLANLIKLNSILKSDFIQIKSHLLLFFLLIKFNLKIIYGFFHKVLDGDSII